jgi:SAM-dependent methyltransferase
MAPRSRNESFHDRWAGRYDAAYEDDPYWRFYRTITWNHLKPHLPRSQPARVLDLGCGTGEWGIKLLRSGFEVTFVDLSQGMLDQAARKVEELGLGTKATFAKAEIAALEGLEESAYAFATAQGDPLSMTPDPRAALRRIGALLAPGACLVASVDARAAQVDAFFEHADWEGLQQLVERGRSEFLTRRREERFETHAFEIEELEQLCRKAGLEWVDGIGKLVLPLRRYPEWLADEKRFRELVRREESLHRKVSWIGRASHLQFVARRPRGEA